jgi:2-oxo-4-hydroxy-4-carboxy-5-ureidoimidazoline decarboxylase
VLQLAALSCDGDTDLDHVGMKFSLQEINALPAPAFVDRLAHIFEHSPWVAEAVAPQRPFASVAALHDAMVAAVAAAEPAAQLALLRAHPELARRGPLTAESQAEQRGHGLDSLAAGEAEAFAASNAAYAARFGFPFIIAVRGQRDRAAILAALQARLAHTQADEQRTALAEVAKIGRFRLDDLISEAGA